MARYIKSLRDTKCFMQNRGLMSKEGKVTSLGNEIESFVVSNKVTITELPSVLKQHIGELLYTTNEQLTEINTKLGITEVATVPNVPKETTPKKETKPEKVISEITDTPELKKGQVKKLVGDIDSVSKNELTDTLIGLLTDPDWNNQVLPDAFFEDVFSKLKLNPETKAELNGFLMYLTQEGKKIGIEVIKGSTTDSFAIKVIDQQKLKDWYSSFLGRKTSPQITKEKELDKEDSRSIEEQKKPLTKAGKNLLDKVKQALKSDDLNVISRLYEAAKQYNIADKNQKYNLTELSAAISKLGDHVEEVGATKSKEELRKTTNSKLALKKEVIQKIVASKRRQAKSRRANLPHTRAASKVNNISNWLKRLLDGAKAIDKSTYKKELIADIAKAISSMPRAADLKAKYKELYDAAPTKLKELMKEINELSFNISDRIFNFSLQSNYRENIDVQRLHEMFSAKDRADLQALQKKADYAADAVIIAELFDKKGIVYSKDSVYKKQQVRKEDIFDTLEALGATTTLVNYMMKEYPSNWKDGRDGFVNKVEQYIKARTEVLRGKTAEEEKKVVKQMSSEERLSDPQAAQRRKEQEEFEKKEKDTVKNTGKAAPATLFPFEAEASFESIEGFIFGGVVASTRDRTLGARKSRIESIISDIKEKLFNIQTRDNLPISKQYSEYLSFLNSGQSVGNSRAISKEIKGFVKQIQEQFKLTGKIFITTDTEVKFDKTSGLDFKPIYTETGKYAGMMIPTNDGNYILALNDNVINDKANLVSTLSHEVGHAIIWEHYENADKATKDAIIKDFSRWAGTIDSGQMIALSELYEEQGKTLEDFKREFKEYLTDGKVDENNKKKFDGLFQEYLAQQISKYIQQRHIKAEGAVAKFFTSLVDKLKQVYAAVTSESIRNKVPVQSVSTWLDGLLESQRISRRLEDGFDMATDARTFGPMYSRINADVLTEKSKGLFNQFVDNFLLDAYWAGKLKNAVVGTLLRIQTAIQNENAKRTYEIQLDARDNNVVKDYHSRVLDLDNEQTQELNEALYLGNDKETVYKTKDELNQALVAAGKNAVTDTQFKLYQDAVKLIDNMFRQENKVLFYDTFDSYFGHLSDDIKRSIMQGIAMEKVTSKAKKKFLSNALAATSLTTEEQDTIVKDFSQLHRALRRPLKFYLEGGVTGGVRQMRQSAGEQATYKVEVWANEPAPKGGVKHVLKYSKFFDTNVAATKHEQELKTSNSALETALGKGTTIDRTNLAIHLNDSFTDASANMFRINESDRALTLAAINETLKSIGDRKDLDSDTINKIKRGLNAEFARRILERGNKQAIRRKGKIQGYDRTIDPVLGELSAAQSTFTYLARKKYISDSLSFIKDLQGKDKLDAIEEFKQSLESVGDKTKVLSEAITLSALAGNVVTAVTQTFQYIAYLPARLVSEGVPVHKAITIGFDSYVRTLYNRINIDAREINQAIKTKPSIRFIINKVLMGGKTINGQLPTSFLTNSFDRVFEKRVLGKQYLKQDAVLSTDEKELLEIHRRTNETTDVQSRIEYDLNTSIRSTVSQKLRSYVQPLAFAFNQMEVTNREASLLAAYNALKTLPEYKDITSSDPVKKQAAFEKINIKASEILIDVNGQFSSLNKIGIVRKYKGLQPLMQLTSFFFLTTGQLASYLGKASKILTKKGFSDKHVRSEAARNMTSFMMVLAATLIIGGSKGLPFAETFNKLLMRLLGRDFMLELEQAVKNNTKDRGQLIKVVGDILTRGISTTGQIMDKRLGIDFASNVSMRVPLEDVWFSLMDGKVPSLEQAGAGGRMLKNTIELMGTTKDLFNGESEWYDVFAKFPVAGIQNVGKSIKYSYEGDVDTKGRPKPFAGKLSDDKPNRITATMKAMGVKTQEEGLKADIRNSEYKQEQYWNNAKKDALGAFFKKIDPYVLAGKGIPSEVLTKANKHIQEYNNEWMKAPEEVKSLVKPIQNPTKVAQMRYQGKRSRIPFEKQFETLVD